MARWPSVAARHKNIFLTFPANRSGCQNSRSGRPSASRSHAKSQFPRMSTSAYFVELGQPDLFAIIFRLAPALGSRGLRCDCHHLCRRRNSSSSSLIALPSANSGSSAGVQCCVAPYFGELLLAGCLGKGHGQPQLRVLLKRLPGSMIAATGDRDRGGPSLWPSRPGGWADSAQRRRAIVRYGRDARLQI
jgi:hypothetical protein